MATDAAPLISNYHLSAPSMGQTLFTASSLGLERDGFDGTTGNAGAYGDQTPIELFREIADRLERMSQALSSNATGIAANCQMFKDSAAVDPEQRKAAGRLHTSLTNLNETVEIETGALKRAVDQGFKDLGVALDEELQLTRDLSAELICSLQANIERRRAEEDDD
ncbi:unnamed protein product [Peniophora sp. CBMAI 1063]|nr:unnamed protein product [Peniophora sp. CBMAI 1063]